MDSTSENLGRANIRIEIKNDFSEAMEVDSDDEIEDGEISDGKENTDFENSQPKYKENILSHRIVNQWENSEGGFITEQDEQEKLETRAKRFGIEQSTFKTINDEQLRDLYESLGITDDVEINTRFEAIHMYGTKEMSTKNVFDYFEKYGPTSIEWINDESCNVVWFDKISAAKALHSLSKQISGMPVLGKCDPFQNKIEKAAKKSTSILVISKDRQVQISDDSDEDKTASIMDVSEIDIPIPPGYWRLGERHPKAKYILLRFANRTDKKPVKAEKFSEDYKKYGNPNYGGIRGLISESKKKQLKGDIKKNLNIEEEKIIKGNPWGNLAKDWNKDILEKPAENITKVPSQSKSKANISVLNRLGTLKKRTLESDKEDSGEEKTIKKSKVPRMRMYADEEEARLKKMKEMKKLRELEKITENMADNNLPDLRNRIKKNNKSKIISDKVNPLIDNRIGAIRPDITVYAKNNITTPQIVSDTSDDDLTVQQRSKVTVVVKKQSKPSVASTIWSRLDREKRHKAANKSDSESESSSSEKNSSESDSSSDTEHQDFSKLLTDRPGFNRNLKFKFGLTKDHKSPLRIEINNDRFKK